MRIAHIQHTTYFQIIESFPGCSLTKSLTVAFLSASCRPRLYNSGTGCTARRGVIAAVCASGRSVRKMMAMAFLAERCESGGAKRQPSTSSFATLTLANRILNLSGSFLMLKL